MSLRPATAQYPHTLTLAWSADQNHGRVSTLTGRAPLFAIVGRIAAGEPADEVAADFDLTPEQVNLIRVLAEEVGTWT